MKLIHRLQEVLFDGEDNPDPSDDTANERLEVSARHRQYEDDLRVVRLRKERRLRGFN